MNLHTHTHHSPDAAQDTVADRIAAAQKIGLRYMAVTDHVEINRYYPAAFYGEKPSADDLYDEKAYDGKAVFEGSVAEITAAKDAAEAAGITLLCGAEIGQIPQDTEKSSMLYADPRIDLILGSVHELPGKPDFYFLDYEKEDIPALITAYFDEVLRLAQTDCWDVLSHLTYGLRYLPDRAAFDLTPHLPVIDEIFRTVIAKNKAIELNGSGLKSSPTFTDPDFALLKRYRKAGGRYLTVSTDAHTTEYLGYGIDALEQMAREAGFSELTWFQQHQPVLIPLQ